MKLCDKHLEIIKNIDSKADSNVVFSEFINDNVGPEHQDRVEKRKDKCPMCWMGKISIVKIKEIIEKKDFLVV